MNTQLMAVLEKLKIGEIKSAMDQLKSIYGDVAFVKQEIENLYTELESKVSLVSRKQEGSNVVSKLGSGIISNITGAGTILNGSGTLFTKEVGINDLIKIGSDTVTVTAFDITTPDITLTITPAIATSYTDQIYAIIKTATREVLTGEFDFGILNGATFNGVVLQDSTLETYGRMVQPADVVNVSFVQKQTTPIMIRAQNAIQRDGDTIIGPSTSNKYGYTFDKTTFTFGPESTLDFEGIIGNPTSLATKQYVDDSKTAITDDKFFAHWQTGIVGVNGTCHYINYSGVLCPFGNAPLEKSDNFDNCIQVTTAGLKAIGKKRRVMIVANGIGGKNYGNDIIQADMYIKKNGIIYSHSADGYDGASGGVFSNVGTSVFAIMELDPTLDTVVAGYNSDQGPAEISVSIFSI